MRRSVMVLVLLAAVLRVVHPTVANSIPTDPIDAFAWGSSFYGQVGNGMVGFATIPVDVSRYSTAEAGSVFSRR